MQQHEIRQFLMNYFEANGAQIIVNHPAYLTVQLTIELDKALMNRPFYWHYLEKTGGIPNPATLTLITDPVQVPEGVKGETIHFGSPRLHQIFQSTNSLAKYIRLYELPSGQAQQQTPLHPWLAVNVKASFVCDRKKDVLFSIGLHLLTGRMVNDCHQKLKELQLTPKIPDFSFTLSPIIMPKSGMGRIDRYIRMQLAEENHEWAERAIQKWEADQRLLDHFYEDREEQDASYELEKEALRQQYEPNINISVINGGMFYLSEGAV
ncbi:YqhG family protein [Bacillus testis]|uniref:YqhG family protein n=1 Tax=Bacillus testis TaxID=1622072 RepID=UPI00067F1886|nr:YqhG family protein [Bacillus testis]